MLRKTVLAAFLTVAFAAPAFANSCPKHMASIDAALAKNPNMSAQQLAEVKQLRSQGEELHKAGKHSESMAALSKAEGMLGIK